ncbi:MAG: nucleotidyltransferase domain-containing protein [Candidatus Pseudobacter hemicellulosilyticus]|uniref:Nucleotidyltransferase domain-containing protein n=1 Tax=Candidatus Pseudobacter hemicellulosilyticus TaxID=3121375 RepID=A0AAJ5WPY6_9BACT|nr:MAG: nucleotidyltransferase domain-containing protein [Pseudobacter sp.]
MLTIEQVKANGWLILETIAGSRAYGLATASSDTDIRGVFVLPKAQFYGLDYTPQVANDSNDIVYYELKRFIELLVRNNPNIMELLATPEDCILYKHPVMDLVDPALFLSKLCEQSFANYAYTQIKKAYGLEKKIMQPMEAERKSVLDFCYVYLGKSTIPLAAFLQMQGYRQEEMGLAAVAHLRDCYNLFHSTVHPCSGVVRKDAANEVCLSSIPPGEIPVGLLYFNKDGYSVYCKKYKEYWDWVASRNEVRYQSTMHHGKKYDAKNMMHVFRLLLMAKEIATEGRINVRRYDRDFLLDIREGKFEYEDLVAQATTLKNDLAQYYAKSSLPEQPDLLLAERLLLHMREACYQ